MYPYRFFNTLLVLLLISGPVFGDETITSSRRNPNAARREGATEIGELPEPKAITLGEQSVEQKQGISGLLSIPDIVAEQEK